MTFKVKPLSDRIIVKPFDAETKTAAGIIIPDSVKEKPQKGTVMAAGPGRGSDKMSIKEGDVVLYGKHIGSDIQIDDVDYLIMRESDVYAII